jgi:hypothetical protein
MPCDGELPASLAPFASRQAIQVRPDPDFHRDMDRLNAALQELLIRPRRVVVLALTVLTGAWWYASNPVSTAPAALVSVLIADFQNRSFLGPNGAGKTST